MYSSDIALTCDYCSSQTGYSCCLNNDTVISEITPDDVRDKTITVTWEAEEISSGAFRQDNNNGDHVIKCNAIQRRANRMSIIIIKGMWYVYLALDIHSQIVEIKSAMIIHTYFCMCNCASAPNDQFRTLSQMFMIQHTEICLSSDLAVYNTVELGLAYSVRYH